MSMKKIFVLFVCLFCITSFGSWVSGGGAGGGPGSDTTAIHDNIDDEINQVSEKLSPLVGDFLLIEDSTATWAKKKIKIGNIPGLGVETDPLSLHIDGSNSMVADIKSGGVGLYDVGSSGFPFKTGYFGTVEVGTDLDVGGVASIEDFRLRDSADTVDVYKLTSSNGTTNMTWQNQQGSASFIIRDFAQDGSGSVDFYLINDASTQFVHLYSFTDGDTYFFAATCRKILTLSEEASK